MVGCVHVAVSLYLCYAFLRPLRHAADRLGGADPAMRAQMLRVLVATVVAVVSTSVACRWSMTVARLLVTDAHADLVVERRAPRATPSAFSLFDSPSSTPARVVVVVERAMDIQSRRRLSPRSSPRSRRGQRVGTSRDSSDPRIDRCLVLDTFRSPCACVRAHACDRHVYGGTRGS